MKQLIFILALALTSVKSQAQNKYWVYFDAKPSESMDQCYVSDRTYQNRRLLGLPERQHSDIPVNPDYSKALSQLDIEIICESRWLNALSARMSENQMEEALKFDFVVAIEPMLGRMVATAPNKEYNSDPWEWAFNELNGQLIKDSGLSGKNVPIGIIDGGFMGAHENKFLKKLVKNEQVVAMKDFVNPAVSNLFDPQGPDTNKHGAYVMQMLSGSTNKIQYGLATDAKLYLAKTDNSFSEFRGEQDLWVEAIEWLDSLGVRLINSSLGYSYDFDDPSENYKPEDMNGKTSVIALAANMATQEKGMIIVTSIGNEGQNKNWQVITTPSDAEGVIAVGAADIDYWIKPSFSSIGPESLAYLKPNVTCPSADGTSFSAPFVTGLIACMLELNPSLTNREVKAIIERSGHLYPYGNNYMGYGLPLADRVMTLVKDPEYENDKNTEMRVSADSVLIDLNQLRAEPGEVLTFFFKKNERVVHEQAISSREEIWLNKLQGIERITIASRTKVLELIWE